MKRRRVVEVKVEPRPVCQAQSHAIRIANARERIFHESAIAHPVFVLASIWLI